MNIQCITVFNMGSSSVKFQVFSNTQELQLIAAGKVTDLGNDPVFEAVDYLNQNLRTNTQLPAHFNQEDALLAIIAWIQKDHQQWCIQAFAHRVVHGGTRFDKSVIINDEVMEYLSQYNVLAPLHQPHNLKAISLINKHFPKITQIACFDTAFHLHHSALFTDYALPEVLRNQGIRRFGFHGLSFEWIARELHQTHPELAKSRVVVAHLGNGASLCAMNNGLSVDTTMGLTALDGLPMGTRCGSIDPGAILHMIKNLKIHPDALEEILYNDSGLLGLSGQTNNVKTLETLDNEKAQFALDFFALKTAQYIGMMTIALGGIDAMIFTGGIGEHSERIRSQIMTHLDCLQPFIVKIIPANEEKMMALHAIALIQAQ